MTFLQKPYSEYTKVNKPVVVMMSYEGSDDEEQELKTVPVIINNNNVNVVSDSDSDSSKKDFKNDGNKFFDEDINDQVKTTPQTTINAKVVWPMKKLQALYNIDAKKLSNNQQKEVQSKI